jgi:hypothetical protein
LILLHLQISKEAAGYYKRTNYDNFVFGLRPFDAKLLFSMLHSTPQISSLDPDVKYRQVLPFNVYLNIAGELTQPEISFKLDMPEEGPQGALGGEVYGRIQ